MRTPLIFTARPKQSFELSIFLGCRGRPLVLQLGSSRTTAKASFSFQIQPGPCLSEVMQRISDTAMDEAPRGLQCFRGSTASAMVDGAQPRKPVSWIKPREIPGVVCHRPHLVRTVGAAAVVGTILFLVNHLDVVLAGEQTTSTWVKSATTYLVRFFVANYGILTATRVRNP